MNHDTDIVIEERTPTLLEYQTMRGTTDWHPVNDEAVAKGLEATLYAVCVWDREVMVGTGRVIGDGGLYYYIQDMMITPSHQQKGLGKLILKKLMAYIEGVACDGAFVGLMAAKGVEGFYHKMGFRTRPETGPGMYLEIKK